MSELSHDTADDGFHEIQLNGKQLVFLFIMMTLVSVAIFLCGVLVGRGARAARGEEAIEATATQTPAPAPVADAGPPSAEPPPAAAETPDELSYHKRLQAAGTPSEELKPSAQAQPAPAPTQPRATPPAQAARPADVPTEGQPGTHVIQIQALRDREVAVSLVNRLVGKGYPAFLVSPTSGSTPGFFKVQVGRYADQREAEQVKLRLMKEEQFKPWITR